MHQHAHRDTTPVEDRDRRDLRPGHRHGQEHDHDQGRRHQHDPDHGRAHPQGGLRGFLHETFVPHSHDTANKVDDALQASGEGIRAVRISLLVMMVTAVVQAVIVAFSGSVALLADTVHNFSDALTSVPLWIAFVLSRRLPTRRFTYGLGRAEDLAGLFIVAMIALSAVVAGWQAIDRLIDPRPLENLGWVAAAGVVGFLGNEIVARYRLEVGRRIGSAALEADGIHARTDGFTSLAVVLGALGVRLGFPLADPIIGLVISGAIALMLVRTAADIWTRLMDGVPPEVVHGVARDLAAVGDVRGVHDLRVRSVGHTHHLEVTLDVAPGLSLEGAEEVRRTAEHAVRRGLPRLGTSTIAVHPEHD